MTFSNPSTQPSRENSILILKASLKVINHDKNDSLYFVFIQYASQFCIYFSTSIAFAEVSKLLFFRINFESRRTSRKFYDGNDVGKNISECLYTCRKIGKQPGVCINRHSTESSVSQLWSLHLQIMNQKKTRRNVSEFQKPLRFY